MKRFLATAILSSIFCLASCRHATQENFVVVRVYRDRNSDFASELDRRLYAFNDYGNYQRVGSGKVIVVETTEPVDYQKELGGKVAQVKPQLIILNSPEDARLVGGMQLDLQQGKSACGGNRNCPALIPPWVTGEELEATRAVFTAITTE